MTDSAEPSVKALLKHSMAMFPLCAAPMIDLPVCQNQICAARMVRRLLMRQVSMALLLVLGWRWNSDWQSGPDQADAEPLDWSHAE
jgi:hypothetical protein